MYTVGASVGIETRSRAIRLPVSNYGSPCSGSVVEAAVCRHLAPLSTDPLPTQKNRPMCRPQWNVTFSEPVEFANLNGKVVWRSESQDSKALDSGVVTAPLRPPVSFIDGRVLSVTLDGCLLASETYVLSFSNDSIRGATSGESWAPKPEFEAVYFTSGEGVELSPWSTCSADCGGGIRTRDALCIGADRTELADGDSCSGVAREQPCHVAPCVEDSCQGSACSIRASLLVHAHSIGAERMVWVLADLRSQSGIAAVGEALAWCFQTGADTFVVGSVHDSSGMINISYEIQPEAETARRVSNLVHQVSSHDAVALDCIKTRLTTDLTQHAMSGGSALTSRRLEARDESGLAILANAIASGDARIVQTQPVVGTSTSGAFSFAWLAWAVTVLAACVLLLFILWLCWRCKPVATPKPPAADPVIAKPPGLPYPRLRMHERRGRVPDVKPTDPLVSEQQPLMWVPPPPPVTSPQDTATPVLDTTAEFTPITAEELLQLPEIHGYDDVELVSARPLL